jgi:hypothetical protein
VTRIARHASNVAQLGAGSAHFWPKNSGMPLAEKHGMHRTSSIIRAVLLLTTLAACNEPETGASGAPDSGQPEPEASLPTQPDTFKIALAGTPCFGSCPTYSASLDQDGNVTFIGERCAARPGVFSLNVGKKEARTVYDALIASEYASLGDRYTQEEDGCDVYTDSPTYRWNVSADDKQKPLERYAGCEGVDGLEEVDAVMAVFHEHAQTLRFLEPNPFNCDYGDTNVEDVSLRLSHAGTPYALLKISAPTRWKGSFELEDCSGTLLAHGDVQSESRRWVLLSEDRTPLVLPGDVGEAGSLVVDLEPVPFGKPAMIRDVRALRTEDSVTFEHTVASSCDE